MIVLRNMLNNKIWIHAHFNMDHPGNLEDISDGLSGIISVGTFPFCTKVDLGELPVVVFDVMIRKVFKEIL